MTLGAVKVSIAKNMEQSYKMPEDDVLAEKVFEAMLYVATACEPQVLLRFKHVDDDAMYRDLKNGFFIMMPEYPDFSSPARQLQIDDTLAYAVINYTCFMLSGKVEFDTVCARWISLFKKNDLNSFNGDEINAD